MAHEKKTMCAHLEILKTKEEGGGEKCRVNNPAPGPPLGVNCPKNKEVHERSTMIDAPFLNFYIDRKFHLTNRRVIVGITRRCVG